MTKDASCAGRLPLKLAGPDRVIPPYLPPQVLGGTLDTSVPRGRRARSWGQRVDEPQPVHEVAESVLLYVRRGMREWVSRAQRCSATVTDQTYGDVFSSDQGVVRVAWREDATGSGIVVGDDLRDFSRIELGDPGLDSRLVILGGSHRSGSDGRRRGSRRCRRGGGCRGRWGRSRSLSRCALLGLRDRLDEGEGWVSPVMHHGSRMPG